MDEILVPLSQDELERDIGIQLAAMRARREPGRIPDNPFIAKALTDRLLRCGLVVFRRVNSGLNTSLHSQISKTPE